MAKKKKQHHGEADTNFEGSSEGANEAKWSTPTSNCRL